MFKDVKKKILPILIVLALVISNTIGINGALIVKADTTKTFDIVDITDFHGQLLDSTNTLPVGSALAFTIKNIQAANPDRTLIIGGGDLYQGTPVSNVLHGVPVQKVMTNIGMEATALGNHEFDWGLDVINNETMNGAGYEILCANLYAKGTTETVYKPYDIFAKDGVRIAVIGGITNEAPTIILPANTANYEFKDLTTELNKEAKEIRDNNYADIVLADVHEGGEALNDVVSHLHGIDAVFGGHNHQSYDGVVTDADGKNVPVLNAMAQGKGYIDLKITVDSTKKITGFSSNGSNWHPLSYTATSVTDPTCKQIVDGASAMLLPILNTIIGNDAEAYTSTQQGSPYGESQLGNWMADVVRSKADADVGIFNNGGIRLSSIPTGNVTVGTMFNLIPFDNTITTVTMTGAQLKTVLEQAVQDNGKGIQVSGIKFTYDTSKISYKPPVTTAEGIIAEVPGERIQSITRESNGTAVRTTDIVKVAAPDFVGTGGDTFTEFTVPEIKATYVDSHVLVRDALTYDIRNKGKITVVMPKRITNISPVKMTIAEARAKQTGSAILTGYVTAVNGNNVFIQDDEGSPTAGICVYNKSGTTFTVHKGDKITVTGPLSLHNNLLEITPVASSNVIIESSNNTLTPKELKISDINSSMQGQLIKVKNVTFTSIDTTASSMIKDEQGSTIEIYSMPEIPGLTVNDKADITAAVSQYNSNMELAVDSQEDVVKIVPPAVAINDLAAVAGEKTVTLTFTAPKGATSVDVQQSLDGISFVKAIAADAITETSTNAVVAGLTNGVNYSFRLVVTGGEHAGTSNVVTATPLALIPPPPPAPVVTAAPSEANITVTNNVEGTQDLIAVTGLNAGDTVKVYNALTAGSLLGIGTVSDRQTSATINVAQLGKDVGNIYVSVTSIGKSESLRTQKAYAAEIRNSMISMTAAGFDKNINNQFDLNVFVAFNGNTLMGINNENKVLINGTDYVVSGNVITIKKNYLLNQNLGSFVLTFNFSSGSAQAMTVNIVDTTVPPVIEKLSIDKQNPKDARAGEAYSYTFTATGGIGTKTYSLATGNLPQGLILSSNGVLSGVTTSSAISTFTVEVTDSNVPANKDSYSFVLRILDKISSALKNLTISTGSLNESFSETTNSYTARVGHGVSSIKVTPTVKDNTASVKVNGIPVVSGQESQDVSLNVGLNKITVEVTATDGTKGEYVINVTRAKKNSSNSGGSSSSGSTSNSGSSNGTGNTGNQPGTNSSNTAGNSEVKPTELETNIGAIINNAKEYGVVGETIDGKDIVESVTRDKQIEIAFNDALKESTVTNNNVYVLDSKGNKVEVIVKYDAENKKLIVTPVKDYTEGEKYTLYIKDIASAEDKKLEQAVKYSFGIETGSEQKKPEVNKPKEDNKKPEVSEETVEAKVAEAINTKRFGTYNEAYAMILSLSEEKQAYYFGKLNEIAGEVYTELNKKILEEIKTFVMDANLRSYEDMLTEINNKVEDPIDKGYFLGELTSWGKQLVYTKDVLEAVDKIIKAYTEKTVEAIYNAEQAVEKIDNVKTKGYLKEELKKAAFKVDNLTISYFN
jgi:2',3'-cyclic-nucleotide 2'-phosphodiesterase (5'-nucleotidase family)